jgi:hypothetical protein
VKQGVNVQKNVSERACESHIRMFDAHGGTCNSGWRQNFVEVVANELQIRWWCHTRGRMRDDRETWDSVGIGRLISDNSWNKAERSYL